MPGEDEAAAVGEVEIRNDIVYADHDGKLLGDFYLPKGATKAPAIVAVHGGAWARRNRRSYQYWGPFLAARGYAVFEITYRLGKAGVYPNAVNDVKSAVQFVRANAAEYGIDPERIGMMGDSAGGHLIAMVALASGAFNDCRDEAHGKVSAQVKAAVGFYGIYDLLAQWRFDLVAQPGNSMTEDFLGVSPLRNRRIFFDASPVSHATIDSTKTQFLLIAGTDDDIVDPIQTKNFRDALAQAGIKARRIVIPGAGHSFVGEPFEDDPHAANSAVAAPVLSFLSASL